MNDIFSIMLAPLLLIHLFFVMAVAQKNLSVIDTAWSLGFILIALTGSFLNHFQFLKQNITLLMTCLWGLRLAVFIHFRNHGKGEDFRYAAWRKDWGEKTNLIAYFKVYWLQFILMQVVALPLLAIHISPTGNLTPINILGIFLWGLGLIWETVADYQKSKFKSLPNQAHKICNVGLWSLSRHPNYFGEALLWWGIGLSVFKLEFAWCLLGPAFLNFLLLKVSGVPLIEERHKHNPEFQIYASETPVMIPSFKKIKQKVWK